MSYPQIKVEIAFISNPFATPDFTGGDVTAYLADRFVIRRGRADELAEFPAGTLTLTLRNKDRRFDPANTSSPHAGRLLPMRDIRVSAIWLGVTYVLFYGYITAWSMRYENGNIAYADLSCVDGSEPLSRLQLGTAAAPLTLVSSDGDDRVTAVLNNVLWPAGARTIDTAASFTLQESILDGVPALEYLQLIARSEAGQFYIGREGNAHYEGRLFRSSASSAGTWGDAADGSELDYRDLDTSYTVDTIWNRAEIMADGDGHELMVAQDLASQTAYLTRTISRTGLLLANDADALTIAGDIVFFGANPRVRARSLKPQPHTFNTWPQVLSREISDRITVRRHTMLGGTLLDIQAIIEGIGIEGVRNDLEWTWYFEWFLSSI